MVTSLSSRTISWLRFACACLVVLLHAFGPPAAPGQAIVWSNGVYDTVRILLSQGVCQIAVPVFFLISGYLFFVRLEEWTGHVADPHGGVRKADDTGRRDAAS